MICKPGDSVKTQEVPRAILLGLQAFHQDTGQIWDTLKSRERYKGPCFILRKAPSSALLLKKLKV